MTIGLLASGCGEAKSKQPAATTDRGSGEIVDPAKATSALTKQTGLRIEFRPGPTPAGYDRAIYGTAINARGVKIDFGFFFAPKVGGFVPTRLYGLVPHATDNGSATGKSYVMVSSAEYDNRRSNKVREEEFEMSSNMHWTVAALAPRAIREESP